MTPLDSHGSLSLYIIYTSEIDSLLFATSVLGHLYADDIHAYLPCHFGDEPGFGCPGNLRLNPSKTHFIWLCTPQQLAAKLNLAAIAADFPI